MDIPIYMYIYLLSRVQDITSAELYSNTVLFSKSRDEVLQGGIVFRKIRYEVHRIMYQDKIATTDAKVIWGRTPAEIPDDTVGIVIYNVGADVDDPSTSVFILATFKTPLLCCQIVPKMLDASLSMKV